MRQIPSDLLEQLIPYTGGTFISWITSHPELRSLGEFETCPDWVPAMDSVGGSRITLKTISVHRFDHTATWAAKVRNVSRLGSHFLVSHSLIDGMATLIAVHRAP